MLTFDKVNLNVILKCLVLNNLILSEFNVDFKFYFTQWRGKNLQCSNTGFTIFCRLSIEWQILLPPSLPGAQFSFSDQMLFISLLVLRILLFLFLSKQTSFFFNCLMYLVH